MTVSEVYDRSIHMFKISFWTQLAFTAIVSIASFFAISIISLITVVAMFTSNNFVLASIVVYLSILAVVSVTFSGHILISWQAIYGYRTKMHLRLIPKIAMRVFFTLIPISIFIILKTAIAIGVIFLAFWFADFGLPTPIIVIFLLFSAILLILAWFLTLNILPLSITASVFEEKMFFSAIIRAWKLTKGEFFKMAFTHLMWLVVVFSFSVILQFGIQFVFFMLGMIPDLFNASINTSFLMVSRLLGIFSLIFMIATAPLSGIFYTVVFYNQRIKKEGLDIEIALERLRL